MSGLTRKKMEIETLDQVNIRPGVSVLSVLKHLNYKPWFALAEFVDNSVQSYLFNKKKLVKLHGKGFKLKVRIDIESSYPPRISIKDNAAGISQVDFPRAFRPAAIPPDCSGLSEFGMGMKSAACWFSSKWQARTKAIGENVERLVRFNIEKIINEQIEEVEISETLNDENTHFTEIVLDELHHLPVKKTLAKVKMHIADIYRVYIREGILELQIGDEKLSCPEPTILKAPFFRNTKSSAKVWKKEIEFDFGQGLSAKGFAGLRDPGNYARSGFALFRRGRLIQGSADEGYKPPLIFGQLGSFRSLRLFGELHLEGFDVSHTKDGFRWDENEQPFLELLKENLDSEELPLLKQADVYRALATRNERKAAAQKAIEKAVDAMERNLSDVLPAIADESPLETETMALKEQPSLAKREFEIDFRNEKWLIKIELTDDPAESQWLSVSDHHEPTANSRHVLEIRLSLTHPFMVSFAQTDPDDIEALLRVAGGLALAEKLARRSGVRFTGTIRRNLNDILREALSNR